MKTWNQLCLVAKEAKKDRLNEKDYERNINLFIQTWLEWTAKDDAIKEQYKIDFANTRGYADFVLFHNSREEIVLELKEPNHKKEDKDIRQLTDYMKALRCCFGIYLGEKLELYYDDYDKTKKRAEPVLVASYELCEGNTEGELLMDLLQKKTYSTENMESYCKNRIKVSNIVLYWNSQKGKDELYKFMLSKESLSEELVKLLGCMINVEVYLNEGKLSKQVSCDNSTNEASDNMLIYSNVTNEKKEKNTEVFSLDNVNFYPKRRFVAFVIEKLLKENPKLSYNDLESILPLRTDNNKVLLKKQEWEMKSKDAQKRYVLNDVPVLKDANGQEFYVSGQWGIELFEKTILPLITEFGWHYYRKELEK